MDIAFRAAALYAFVFVVMRIMGRRELSSLAPFDLVLLIVLGDAIQQGLTQDDYSVTGAMTAVATIALLQVGTSYLGFRIPFLRRVLEGQPIVIPSSYGAAIRSPDYLPAASAACSASACADHSAWSWRSARAISLSSWPA
jgi:hypothetical protein